MMRWSFIGLSGLLLSAPGASAASSPVVVELFDSQGCSSCPPAERVMEKLHDAFGSKVILLAYHVDYWDYLSWKDTFSDPRATVRQKDYGRAFRQDSIYTPEIVIQGEIGFVGSDWRQALSEVQSRLTSTGSAFAVAIKPVSSRLLQVSIELPPELSRQTEEALVVVCENASPVHVLKGENAGATMSGAYAVRALVPIKLSSKEHPSVIIPLDPAWNSRQLGFAVLLRGSSAKILAAQAIFPS